MEVVSVKLMYLCHVLHRLRGGGDMGVYGIAVLGFFSCAISVILI